MVFKLENKYRTQELQLQENFIKVDNLTYENKKNTSQVFIVVVADFFSIDN